MRVLTGADIERSLPIAEAIPVMAEAMRRYSAGDVSQPLRTILRPPRATGLLGTMPCHVAPGHDDQGGFGVKAMVLEPQNPSRGLHLHMGVVLVFDPVTGRPEALLDASAVTAIRTAAVSAVATAALARPGCDVLAILGSGVQAYSHLQAMLVTRPEVREIRVWSRTRHNAEKLRDRAGRDLGVDVRLAGGPGEALDGADLVCTTLATREPVVEASFLAAGAHVNAVGASFKDHREYTGEAVAAARLFVDSRESALSESGDIGVPLEAGLIGPDHIQAELGEVLLGKHPGRAGPREITMYKSLGLAVQDVMFGFAAAAAAARLGVGTTVELH